MSHVLKIGSGTLISTNYKSHPSINMSFWNCLFSARNPWKARKRSAKGSRKANPPRPDPGPKWASSFCSVSRLQKLFKKMAQNQCAEVKLPHRNIVPNAMNSVNRYYEICIRKHDHILCPDSAGARKGAKGSQKGGVRAVLGYHNFEQPPYKEFNHPKWQNHIFQRGGSTTHQTKL